MSKFDWGSAWSAIIGGAIAGGSAILAAIISANRSAERQAELTRTTSKLLRREEREEEALVKLLTPLENAQARLEPLIPSKGQDSVRGWHVPNQLAPVHQVWNENQGAIFNQGIRDWYKEFRRLANEWNDDWGANEAEAMAVKLRNVCQTMQKEIRERLYGGGTESAP